jgi:hypothetical protein
MTSLLVVIAVLVGHSGSDFFHAKERLIEVGHAKMVVRVNGDVSNLGKHNSILLDSWILFKLHGFCQQRTESAVSSLESRVEPETWASRLEN